MCIMLALLYVQTLFLLLRNPDNWFTKVCVKSLTLLDEFKVMTRKEIPLKSEFPKALINTKGFAELGSIFNRKAIPGDNTLAKETIQQKPIQTNQKHENPGKKKVIRQEVTQY